VLLAVVESAPQCSSGRKKALWLLRMLEGSAPSLQGLEQMILTIRGNYTVMVSA